jgi:hypothetical protein
MNTSSTAPLSHRVLDLKDKFIHYYSETPAKTDDGFSHYRIIEVVGCDTIGQDECATVLAFDYDSYPNNLGKFQLKLENIAFINPALPLTNLQLLKIEKLEN